jgi:hypothetical protein
MTAALRVADISSYLSATGWWRTPETWRGAAIWSSGQTELLVPPTDDMGDADLRIRELLAKLATVEARDSADVATDIGSPFLDSTTYRTGSLSLAAGADVVAGLRRMVLTAARTVVEGPRRSFVGRPPAEVAGLLGSAGLATGRLSGFSVTLSVDVTSDIGRDVAIQIFDATSAVQDSIEQPDDAALDGVAAAGVSAAFCAALGDLGQESFELDFRWAHGLRTALPTRKLAFPPEAGERIHHVARRLRRLDLSGPASVVGRVESLHDSPDGARWRVRIRGELHTDRAISGSRGVWVRMPGQRLYDLAIAAHQTGRLVRVTGFREGATARQDLAVPPDGLEIL